MGVGPQKDADIISKTFKTGVPKGLKRAFRDAKNAHIREKYRQRTKNKVVRSSFLTEFKGE
jgi:hypothetical protein